MSIELEDFEDVSRYLDWALETGIWDGRPISWTNVSEFQGEVQERILKLLLEHPEETRFGQLAWIGTPASNQSLLAREIQKLDFSKGDLILQAGLKKSVSKFWKKHKKEILIGAAIVILVTVVVVVAVSTAGTGAGAAAAAGGAALGAATDKDENPESISSEPSPPPEVAPMAFLALDSSLTDGKLIFGQTGVLIDGEYSSYQDILCPRYEPVLPPVIPNELELPKLDGLQKASTPFADNFLLPPLQECPLAMKPAEIYEPPAWDGEAFTPPQKPFWLITVLESIAKGIIANPNLLDPSITLSNGEQSSRFTIVGNSCAGMQAAGINGIATRYKDAVAHAEYLSKFAKGFSIDWVHNCSHGAVLDLAEVFTMNYFGYSPNTSELLQQNWSAFHLANAGEPDAKYLQYCHSQGAIHVRNALAVLPKEIRDRVIVVAIAPAAIIPKDLCYDSYNYASKKDIVNQGELIWAATFDTTECGVSKVVEMAMENREQLILLEPHPDAVGIDHDFQSPTFREYIERHLHNYISCKGKYK